MSEQVILYFEEQSDALRFALAAGSVMAGEGASARESLARETARANRVRIETADHVSQEQSVAENAA